MPDWNRKFRPGENNPPIFQPDFDSAAIGC
jgi:hypothetical protein